LRGHSEREERLNGKLFRVQAEYLKKGSQVHIEGRSLIRIWTDGVGVKREDAAPT